MRAFVLIVAIATCFGLRDRAEAGYKATSPLSFSYWSGGGSWYGHIGQVRASADSVQYLGCSTTAWPGGSNAWCDARDASGVTRSCWTTNPTLIAVISAITDDAGIYVEWDQNGQCTAIQVEAYSFELPRTP